MSDLADRMRAAADTLEEASQRIGADHKWSWRPDGLRNMARHVEDEDQETAEREAMVRELAWALYENSGWQRGFGFSHRLEAARKLVESGWRKEEPE